MEAEWKTRKTRIDPRLDRAGWRLGAGGAHRTEEHPTDNGPADYALWVGSQALAVVEAKKLSTNPQNVLSQAERYSKGLSANPLRFDAYYVPFLYSTNGELTWFHDVRHPLNRSRRVSGFHTPAALQELLDFDLDFAAARLAALPNNHGRLRPYQRQANEAVERAIAERKRAMLVAMATGTGKTFTMVNQVYRLLKSGVARRVLFLVDRRALAAQAVRAFASFEPEPGLKFDQTYEVFSNRVQSGDADPHDAFDPKLIPRKYLESPGAGDAFVYVCTIQRMAINVLGRDAIFGAGDETIDPDADRLDIPIHAFDVVIADECHRGYTAAEESVWRATLDHFDAIKIGLTATPASHTTTTFRELVYRYSYEQAVEDGYLVDYDAVALRSEVRLNGVFLTEGERVELVDPETGRTRLDQMEDERQFASAEIEERITAPDSNRKLLLEVKKYADQHQERTGRFPKTLIFAVNDKPHVSHANQLVDLARDIFGQGDGFVTKITGSPDVDRPLQRIREFRNRQSPGVAVTVDMLTTGVDIPDLEFLVFLRPVRSRVLFVQMIGRGTRRGERYPDKSHFVVFDGFDGTLLRYFADATDMTSEPLVGPSRTIVEIIEDIWNNVERDYNVRCLVKRLHRIARAMSGEAIPLFARFIPEGDVSAYATGLPAALRRQFTAEMRRLRDPKFQSLLMDYPRARVPFYRAPGIVDEVGSRWVLRDVEGLPYNPEDYLERFERYVREHRDEIAAVRILLERPADWCPRALTELHQRLSEHPLRFTPERLQRATAATRQRALVDLISLVKHAADQASPLLTAEERVDRALSRLSAGRAFSPAQQAWIGAIREHLVTSLSIDQEDFTLVPALERLGGWKAASAVFGEDLAPLLRDLNEGLAA